jgi:hypothetical protein
MAAKDLAGNLPQIGTLVVAPDLLASLLSHLADASQGPQDAGTAGIRP